MNLFEFFFGKKRAGMSEFKKPITSKPKTKHPRPIPPPSPQPSKNPLTRKYEELINDSLAENTYRTKLNEIIKSYLYTLEYTNLDHDVIERTLKIKPIKLSELVNVGGMATDILKLFGKLEKEET